MTPEQLETLPARPRDRLRDLRAGARAASASTSSISAATRPWCCATSPPTCRSIDHLGLPDLLTELAMLKRGLVLLVGATGSGKSTTLAAMINHRNENASDHIVTIEDPIEFLHANKRSIINQREVGLDTKSYYGRAARRGACRARRDPDRRDPRSREHAGGHRSGRHRPPGACDPARQQLRRESRPHHQHVPARSVQAGDCSICRSTCARSWRSGW